MPNTSSPGMMNQLHDCEQDDLATTTATRGTKTSLADRQNEWAVFFKLIGVYFIPLSLVNSLKMANIGKLPYGVLVTAPKFGLQTKSQKEIFYGGVCTDCKEKRAGSSKFVVFSFIYWAQCRRRRLRRCSQDLSMCVNGQESEHGFSKTACHLFTRQIHVCYPRFGPLLNGLLPFSGNRHLGGEGKKSRCCRKNIFQRNNQM